MRQQATVSERAPIPEALIRWPFGLDYPPEIFPMGGSDEIDAAIRERLNSQLKIENG